MNSTNIGTQTIETDRLVLRQFVKEDAEDMFRNWINDKEVQSNYGEPVYESIELVNEVLDCWMESYRSREFFRWAIVLKENKQNIGQIAFCSIDTKHNFADIEYCISKNYQGRGFATEALNAVIEFTFKKTGINRLQAFRRGINAASGKVLEKSFMKYEGTLKGSYYYSETNEYDDRVFYGITRLDFMN
ncbi:ribosomal-protein-alanine N-acetyltransferase [Fontibacillus panacisegetis]|uniref:Ribosomal-protein-alanine N-acetyltransferase n=1 Tax=Fontibacillus panacisegetis TaxID=670482 RepID=A0A1G7EQF2_9BACL|nr:GNAT family N-acetyltransferase [Fontibacillus panacisegetis]SDE65901.1 ribosomal-protein-alanine N-acetyltransferase [Fontibacillus panacisegetis]